jgi:hypothetical protein
MQPCNGRQKKPGVPRDIRTALAHPIDTLAQMDLGASTIILSRAFTLHGDNPTPVFAAETGIAMCMTTLNGRVTGMKRL